MFAKLMDGRVPLVRYLNGPGSDHSGPLTPFRIVFPAGAFRCERRCVGVGHKQQRTPRCCPVPGHPDARPLPRRRTQAGFPLVPRRRPPEPGGGCGVLRVPTQPAPLWTAWLSADTRGLSLGGSCRAWRARPMLFSDFVSFSCSPLRFPSCPLRPHREPSSPCHHGRPA